jgi:hypothetical protein
MEDIGNEISQLMQQLLDGEIIIIDDLPDEQLKHFMVCTLYALQVCCTVL